MPLEIPDIAVLGKQWQERLRLGDWRISFEYKDDLCGPSGPAYGLFVPTNPDDRAAKILICTPQTATDVALLDEIVAHELIHAMLAPLAGHNREPASIAAEERVTWTLAPILAGLKGAQRDSLARALVRAMGRSRGATGKRGNRQMDQTMLAALEAATEAGDIEQVKSLIAKFKELGGGDAAPMAATEEQQEEHGQMAMADDGVKPARRAAARQQAAQATSETTLLVEDPAQRSAVAGLRSQVATMRAELKAESEKREVAAVVERAARAGLIDDDEADMYRKLPLANAKELVADRAKRRTEDGATEEGAAAGPRRQVQRGTSPTRGAARPVDPSMVAVDRAMGVHVNTDPIVVEDPVTGRYSISHARPLSFAKKGT